MNDSLGLTHLFPENSTRTLQPEHTIANTMHGYVAHYHAVQSLMNHLHGTWEFNITGLHDDVQAQKAAWQPQDNQVHDMHAACNMNPGYSHIPHDLVCHVLEVVVYKGREANI